MTKPSFSGAIWEGIPAVLPGKKPYDPGVNHAPKRREVLSAEEKKLAVRNALRYFPPHFHRVLAPEFMEELELYGRIYMYRFRPDYEMKARPLSAYPARSPQAASVMLMIQNNLDPAVAQHPHELITYGGNGAVFQNWAQYLLTMQYLSEMSDEQTLVMYSGHPLGLFPSHPEAPRVVVTNGMMIPNYSTREEYERLNALGVTQYGQMTAGSYMYIGPQGIVHGTTITLLNAARLHSAGDPRGKVFVTSGLGGMSGAQPKAAVIAGMVCVAAEINPKAIRTRKEQGWVDEVYDSLPEVIDRMLEASGKKEALSVAYQGNVVDLWEELARREIPIDLGSDQTSLHNPFAGGYYPAGLTFEESNLMMSSDPERFRGKVQESLRRQVAAINRLTAKGMYFWDYGNAFLLESGRAHADIFAGTGEYRYPSYVQDIMGPLFFDYGFGPFRWVCTSGDSADLAITDELAAEVLEELMKSSPATIRGQMEDNLKWIREAGRNNLVVGSQARILYADAEGRVAIAGAFNKAIREGRISGPIVLGRDHHDVSGTDSPWRETSNIYDGSQLTADMAVQNFAGDSFRGATWVSLHNGGGTGWGEAINGGFGLTLDGSSACDRRLKSMLFWDVSNGIARRSWARNKPAIETIRRAMGKNPLLKITIPHETDEFR
ncbi:MAG: urocanate hydratase [Prolixibacteraceae bacterium]|nr:MAG: Urocanate hydratase [Bacteroidetes bacterium ADurb.Bin123]HOF54867.1 urocanate hydratase [Prolixibacteraceae bacterium]HOR99832.1 urocanate hydratase [Prolixibacteraceae bacterium]HOS89722.1 urocanate hydratase [Prolixibacteraceae bacterium]HPL44724.1 urocanate hydratase [Prolixibacteraceae bacterium]